MVSTYIQFGTKWFTRWYKYNLIAKASDQHNDPKLLTKPCLKKTTKKTIEACQFRYFCHQTRSTTIILKLIYEITIIECKPTIKNYINYTIF